MATDQCKAKKHGESGYRAGGRCGICRKGHSEAAAAYRERKRLRDAGVLPPATEAPAVRPDVEPSSAVVDWNAAPGVVELTVSAELEALIGEPPWKETLLVLAKYNARVLDQLPVMERFDLASGIQSRFLNVLDRLRKMPEGAGALDWNAAAAALSEPE